MNACFLKGTDNNLPRETDNRSAVIRPFPPIVHSPKTRHGKRLTLVVQAILQDGSVALEFMTEDQSEAEQMLLVLPALQ